MSFSSIQGVFNHCTKSIFCNQVSWITVCAKRKGCRRTVWALYRFSLILTPAAAAAELRDRCLSAHSRLGDRSSLGLNSHSSLRVQGIAPCYTPAEELAWALASFSSEPQTFIWHIPKTACESRVQLHLLPQCCLRLSRREEESMPASSQAGIIPVCAEGLWTRPWVQMSPCPLVSPRAAGSALAGPAQPGAGSGSPASPDKDSPTLLTSLVALARS